MILEKFKQRGGKRDWNGGPYGLSLGKSPWGRRNTDTEFFESSTLSTLRLTKMRLVTVVLLDKSGKERHSVVSSRWYASELPNCPKWSKIRELPVTRHEVQKVTDFSDRSINLVGISTKVVQSYLPWSSFSVSRYSCKSD